MVLYQRSACSKVPSPVRHLLLQTLPIVFGTTKLVIPFLSREIKTIKEAFTAT